MYRCKCGALKLGVRWKGVEKWFERNECVCVSYTSTSVQSWEV